VARKGDFCYVDFLADFGARFTTSATTHVLEIVWTQTAYKASQRLAGELLERGSAGVVYPSVRHEGGTLHSVFQARAREQCPERLVHLHHFLKTHLLFPKFENSS